MPDEFVTPEFRTQEITLPAPPDEECPPLEQVHDRIMLQRDAIDGVIRPLSDCLCKNLGAITTNTEKIQKYLRRLVRKELKDVGRNIQRIADYLQQIIAFRISEQQITIGQLMRPAGLVAPPHPAPGRTPIIVEAPPPVVITEQFERTEREEYPGREQPPAPIEIPLGIPPEPVFPEEEERMLPAPAERPEVCVPYDPIKMLAVEAGIEQEYDAGRCLELLESLGISKIPVRAADIPPDAFAQAPEFGTQAPDTYNPNAWGD